MSVVIPVYNGENNIIPLLNEVVPVLDNTESDYEIIFVDDASTDNSFSIIQTEARDNPTIKGFLLKENRGQQNALFCGICRAEGKLIITMDDDLQHPPSLIPELIKRMNEGFDIVYSVNRSKSKSWILSWGTEINNFFFTLFLHKPADIEIGSYRIMKRELIDRFRNTDNAFIYLSALVFTSVPKPAAFSFRYESHERDGVDSRINWKSRFLLFWNLFKQYGPLSSLLRRTGSPYEIGKTI